MHAPKEWEETMTQEEVDFCWEAINDARCDPCTDNYRAARLWVSSQRRRYFKQRDKGCCGFYDEIVERWNGEKQHFDLYIIGFNYGH